MAAEKIITPYTDVPYIPFEEESANEDFTKVRSFQAGFGSKVLRVDRQGLWLGAESFADAPFSVDMLGNVTASSISLSGYIPTGGALADIGAGNITGTYIASNAITTPKIAANAITATEIAAGAVTATKISVSTLSAITANVGTLTSGSITGITITGGTIRTASSGTRVELDGADNDISIYNGSTLRARGYQQGWEFYNPSGTLIGEIYASSSNELLLAGDLTSTGKIFYGVGSSGTHSFHIGTTGSTLRFFIDTNDIIIGDADNLDLDINMLGLVTFNNERGFKTPTVGRVSSGGTLSGGGVGWSASNDSTGVYTVTHNLGSSAYSVVATVESSSGDRKCKIGSRSTNSFTVRCDEGGTLTDMAFNFILMYY